ncbi:GNAT family N-acetyltransferase [Aquirufa sp.]|jgi:GNAT superfamily N-acetyltransferase|uniref:GNAT family N-acetyltransferase n=1 Tax=Aquirufa sp. TaxID=2676249 RepID=UPI003783C421
MDKIIIRRATKEDIGLVRDLVMELAIFERAPEEVTSSLDDYIQEGFSDNPLFSANLIYLNDKLAGFSLWYYRFSTWKGRRFYLEDLYIKEAYRGKGLGKYLINEAIEEAKRMKCTGMMWQVLDWNQPAIDFYNTLGVKMDAGWLNVHLDL